MFILPPRTSSRLLNRSQELLETSSMILKTFQKFLVIHEDIQIIIGEVIRISGILENHSRGRKEVETFYSSIGRQAGNSHWCYTGFYHPKSLL